MSSNSCASNRPIAGSALPRDQLGPLARRRGLKLERFRELAPQPAAAASSPSRCWLGPKPAAVGARRRSNGANVEVAA